MAFNEDTRVKIPTILHMTTLGYEYFSLRDISDQLDTTTNILRQSFINSVQKLNPEVDADSIKNVLNEVVDYLGYDDLGKKFYERITQESGIKLIDFQDLGNNTFNIVTELECRNGDDVFRPDITFFVNGMPLGFIEVKKPNNKGGIVAEADRMNNERTPRYNKFKKFLNAIQLMIFSNNMEYSADGGITPIQGAFYATTSLGKISLNSLKEEDQSIYQSLKKHDDQVENFILKDQNSKVFKYSEEYQTNIDTFTPTKRIVTSLLTPARLLQILKFGIVYVQGEANDYEKHIMRYPQFFATKAIAAHLDKGFKKGIIWHTQGSGKTALAFYNVKFLTEYYRSKNIVPKFHFIVDRLDLLTQAQDEFAKRGLVVTSINSKDDFKKDLAAQNVKSNSDGKSQITVVNIQKFDNNSRVIESADYQLNIQRIYFIDEAHRSYNPQGSFLANLVSSDRNAIFIGLTGTPLLNSKIQSNGQIVEFNSKEIFCDTLNRKLLHDGYIHKYYYNNSIEDGYTLRLIRDGIETTYRTKLNTILDELGIKKGTADSKRIYAHKRYIEPLTDYIVDDFTKSRIRMGDDTIGGMIVSHSSEQASEIHSQIQSRYPNVSSALILHDAHDKDTLKQLRNDFKAGKIDFLIVYNMLLTGFDAPRLKKLYLNRVVKEHNLLQTLTRVNRPYTSKYKTHHYGYVVDFADIKYEFDKTNRAYWAELQDDIGEEAQTYSQLFKSSDEIKSEIFEIKNKLFTYDIRNAEIFSQQIGQINEKETIKDLQRVLENTQILGNLIKLYDYDELWYSLDFLKLSKLLAEVKGRLAIINQAEALQNDGDNSSIINVALEDVLFAFRKTKEDELQLGIIDTLKNLIRQTRGEFQNNFDTKDETYTSLLEELERLFKKRKLTEERTPTELESDIKTLNAIYTRIKEQNRLDEMLREQYKGDKKFVRIHKRLIQSPPFPDGWMRKQIQINQALLAIKEQTEIILSKNQQLLNNESFFKQGIMDTVRNSFASVELGIKFAITTDIVNLVVREYIESYKEVA